MKIHFYIPEKALNDATEYYVGLIKTALEKCNFEIKIQNKKNFIRSKSDFFLTIRVRDFIQIYKTTGSKRIIHWSQGIGPEEYLQTNNYSFKAYIVSFLFSVVEMITLRKAMFNIFVSEAMQQHYEKKYWQKINNYCVVPCYNKHLNKVYFNETQKIKLSFVYAGSLDTWQCFEKTISLFKEINALDKNATLTILTKQTQIAEKLVREKAINNVIIKYVSLEKLDLELSKHQYGFLLRENHIINNVATPTKMNSYLAAGLMPIYTNVITSFKENIDLNNFEIKFNVNDDFSKIANQIVEQNKNINYNEFLNICEQNFKNYYDDEYNTLLLKKKINPFLELQ